MSPETNLEQRSPVLDLALLANEVETRVALLQTAASPDANILLSPTEHRSLISHISHRLPNIQTLNDINANLWRPDAESSRKILAADCFGFDKTNCRPDQLIQLGLLLVSQAGEHVYPAHSSPTPAILRQQFCAQFLYDFFSPNAQLNPSHVPTLFSWFQ